MSIKKQKWLVGSVMWLFSLAAGGAGELVDGYHLMPASAVVKVGATAKLDLVYCIVKSSASRTNPKGQSSDKPRGKYYGENVSDDELAPLREKYRGEEIPDDDLAPLPVMKLVCEGDEGYGDELAPLVPLEVQWRVIDGQGRVSGDNKGATYHAPASRPKPNQATVAVTFKYPLTTGGKNYPKAKQTLLSRITILDEVKTYTGTFSMSDVSVFSEYTTNLTGNIRWEFDDYYEEGAWREYTGSGTAALRISRKGCGTPAEFSNVPVEGRLKVFDDKKYEFLINLVGDAEQTRACRRGDAQWVETYFSGGHAMNQGDPCALKEFYPQYADVTDLSLNRKGGCAHNVRNQYQEGWSFKAVE
ncbi:MAG: hypothetical protein OEM48_09500 [Gammaproteobacteria bacterium]|nr:hypothetical protein [Gammaproteobacteria bacterium]MDH3407136.1 hypothetical protein [Gammaproteobacteria bacterium]